MASGYFFQMEPLSREQKEVWCQCLHGETMDFVHFEPLWKGHGFLWWFLCALGLVGLFVGFFVESWVNWKWFVFQVSSFLFFLGLFQLWRRMYLPQMYPYDIGKYLLPVGLLDVTSTLWRFVPLEQMEDVRLVRLSPDSILVPVPRFSLVFDLIGLEKERISVQIKGKYLAEEALHVMEHLVDDKEEALTGLKEYMDRFASNAKEAASTQGYEHVRDIRAFMEDKKYSILTVLPPFLRHPLLFSMPLGLFLGSLLFWIHLQGFHHV